MFLWLMVILDPFVSSRPPIWHGTHLLATFGHPNAQVPNMVQSSVVAALVLSVCVATEAAQCHDGWTASPAGTCYMLTKEATTHRGCVEACGAGASLACVTSEAENTFVAALATDSNTLCNLDTFVWLGNYQTPGSAEPDGGWAACSSGATTTYTNWASGFPGDQPAEVEQHESCVLLSSTNSSQQDEPFGSWVDNWCWRKRRCLCEHGAEASATYLAFIDADLDALRATAAFFFGVVMPFLWALPPLLFLGYRRLTRGHAPEAVATTTAAGARLAAAEVAEKRQRFRMVSLTGQLGWMLLVLSQMPLFALLLGGAEITPVAGHQSFYFAILPWAILLLLLVLRPVDHGLIRPVGIFLCGFGFSFLPQGLTLDLLNRVLNDPMELLSNPILFAGYLVILYLVAFILVLPLPILVCDCCVGCPARMRLPPRRQLRRLWLTLRLLLFMNAIGNLAISVLAPLYDQSSCFAPTWRADDYQTATVAVIASNLLAAFLFTPANRGRILRRIDELLRTRGSKEEAAAGVAALLGGKRGAAATLAMSTERFCALPLDVLERAELVNNKPDPAMHAKTVPATLGEVHAFVSHSWSDNGDAKFERLHEWAAGAQKLTWLDKACIDQLNISESLACLPVFLAGSKQLLVLIGPTYTSRLWVGDGQGIIMPRLGSGSHACAVPWCSRARSA